MALKTKRSRPMFTSPTLWETENNIIQNCTAMPDIKLAPHSHKDWKTKKINHAILSAAISFSKSNSHFERSRNLEQVILLCCHVRSLTRTSGRSWHRAGTNAMLSCSYLTRAPQLRT
jgi:hypothetical protein